MQTFKCARAPECFRAGTLLATINPRLDALSWADLLQTCPESIEPSCSILPYSGGPQGAALHQNNLATFEGDVSSKMPLKNTMYQQIWKNM